jgi:uncharacterized RDD family membrane protein YckC
MDFLPVMSDGKHVYAGFWKRLYAGLIDFFIIVILFSGISWLQGTDRTVVVIVLVPMTIVFNMYNVFFHARFGATPGKLAAGIRVTKADGTPIGWYDAWKRSSVDLAFAVVVLVVQCQALLQVDPVKYSSLEWLDRAKLVQGNWPDWFQSFRTVEQVWLWSEIVVLLFNQRKRALHDFIAGTVVIHKAFAKRSPESQP